MENATKSFDILATSLNV